VRQARLKAVGDAVCAAAAAVPMCGPSARLVDHRDLGRDSHRRRRRRRHALCRAVGANHCWKRALAGRTSRSEPPSHSLHTLEDVATELAEFCPARHGMHAAELPIPTPVWYAPMLHIVQKFGAIRVRIGTSQEQRTLSLLVAESGMPVPGPRRIRAGLAGSAGACSGSRFVLTAHAVCAGGNKVHTDSSAVRPGPAVGAGARVIPAPLLYVPAEHATHTVAPLPDE
jgi:hypothetical protein